MDKAANRAGKRAVRVANSAVNLAVLLALLLPAAYGGYALWDADQSYRQAAPEQYAIYKPSEEDEGQSFSQLRAINSEVFAWLTVYGTNIDYPVAQGQDNMKYVNTSAEGSYSLSGCIFLNCDNDNGFQDFNSIIYGHHMEKQAMFGELSLFADEEYFEARLYGSIYVDGKEYGLEFFAFLQVDAYDASVFTPGIEGGNARQAYLDGLMEKALYLRDVGVTTEDRLVLLSTCSAQSTNGRDVLVARITNEPAENPFDAGETETVSTQAAALPGEKAGAAWLWVGLPALAVCLLSAALVCIRVFGPGGSRRPGNSSQNTGGSKEQ